MVARVEVGDHGWVSADALLECEAVAWVFPDEFPPVVEVVMTDARGRLWEFHDKAPIFDSTGALGVGSELPHLAFIRVRILDEASDVRISTDVDGVESIDGHNEFLVRSGQLTLIDPS